MKRKMSYGELTTLLTSGMLIVSSAFSKELSEQLGIPRSGESTTFSEDTGASRLEGGE